MYLPRPRPFGIATLVAIAAAALTPSTSLAATPTFDSRDGGCAGTEGVTVVVDLDPTDDSAPSAPVHVRCVFGAPTSGLDALDRTGLDYETSDAFGDPFVCQIEGVPAACDPMGSGYWSYWKQDGVAWTFYDVGAFLARPQPGDVEGWRWVGNYMTDPSDPTRVSPYAVRITDAPAGTLAPGATATFGFAVADAPGTSVRCRVDDAGFWIPCTSATTHAVAGASIGTHTFAVRALDEFGNPTIASRQFTIAAPAPVAPTLAAASLGTVQATVTSAHAATVSAAVNAGGAAQLVHVEYTSGTDRSTAPRTAAASVAAGASASPTFQLTGLAPGTTFAYRVVTSGSVGVVASEWTTFATPRVTVRLKVTAGDRFVARGERVVVHVDRLAAGESVTLALGEAELASGTADEDGEAAIAVRIPPRTKVGAVALVAVGSGSDRTGRVALVVTAPTTLRVAAPASVVVRAKARVTVSGLAANEPVLLRWRGVEVASGVASSTGTFTALVPVGTRPGTYALVAIGSHAVRTGSADIVVAAATARRR